jgi:hypothetical protein
LQEGIRGRGSLHPLGGTRTSPPPVPSRKGRGLFARAVLVLVLLLAFGVTAGKAGELSRFPTPHITPEQWQILFDEVRSKPGSQDISRPDVPSVVAISVPGDLAVYYFTRPGPEHPAVSVEQLVPSHGQLRVRYSGYFAGSEKAFAQWFEAFRHRSEGVRDALQPPQLLCPDQPGQLCP